MGASKAECLHCEASRLAVGTSTGCSGHAIRSHGVERNLGTEYGSLRRDAGRRGLAGPTGGHHYDTLARPESQRRTMKLITMVDAATVLTTARVPISPPRPPRAPAARPSQTKPATHKTAPATSKARNRG